MIKNFRHNNILVAITSKFTDDNLAIKLHFTRVIKLHFIQHFTSVNKSKSKEVYMLRIFT